MAPAEGSSVQQLIEKKRFFLTSRTFRAALLWVKGVCHVTLLLSKFSLIIKSQFASVNCGWCSFAAIAKNWQICALSVIYSIDSITPEF